MAVCALKADFKMKGILPQGTLEYYNEKRL